MSVVVVAHMLCLCWMVFMYFEIVLMTHFHTVTRQWGGQASSYLSKGISLFKIYCHTERYIMT